jgi:hypothetical protein
MPATSRAQWRFMHGVASGDIPPPPGLTRAKAAEYVAGQSSKGLPARAKKRKKRR